MTPSNLERSFTTGVLPGGSTTGLGVHSNTSSAIVVSYCAARVGEREPHTIGSGPIRGATCVRSGEAQLRDTSRIWRYLEHTSAARMVSAYDIRYSNHTFPRRCGRGRPGAGHISRRGPLHARHWQHALSDVASTMANHVALEPEARGFARASIPHRCWARCSF